MTQIIRLDRIKSLIRETDLTPLIEAGFIAYSEGRAVVPPVGELCFDQPPGETHIKYGYIRGADHFVVKIASGFHQNPGLGLPSGSGMMLVFSSNTGRPDTILMDDGYLTDLRTALAGRIAARCLAPSRVGAIGVLGTGRQARMQAEHLAGVTDCRRIVVWGRTQAHAAAYKQDMEARGYSVTATATPSGVAAAANLIVTATPSRSPLLSAKDIRPGTHITAMGSDAPGKQELAADILERSDMVVADSISQCRERGEIASALAAGWLKEKRIRELGQLLATCPDGRARTSETQITVADLTGVAVQDIQIATAVCRAAGQDRKTGPDRTPDNKKEA